MNPDLLLWQSGYTRRWHNNIDYRLRESGDDTGSHQWRTAMLLLMLHPLPSAHLISCALTHDVPEIVTGDVPSPAKQGEMRKVLDHLESEVGAALGIPTTSEKDKKWVELCDQLDAWLWVRERSPAQLVTKNWKNTRERILEIAEELGVKDKVEML